MANPALLLTVSEVKSNFVESIIDPILEDQGNKAVADCVVTTNLSPSDKKKVQNAFSDKFLNRSTIIKLLWCYIKQEELQDPNNKQEIILDANLKHVFGINKKSISMLKMNTKPIYANFLTGKKKLA